ncbi:MAG: hypothetical protein ACK5MJ_01040 [Alphaproteobacteria bacterium]
MLSTISNKVIKNPSSEQIQENPETFFSISSADDTAHNAIKQLLTPVLYSKDCLSQNWIGANFDYTTLFLDATPKKQFKVISYHTSETIYRKGAQRLKESLDKLGIEHHIEEQSSQGSWEANCAKKSSFIYEEWKKSDKPVVWIDCDAIVQQYPILFDYLDDIDFAIHKKQHWEFLSGTVFFNKSKAAERLLQQWVKNCQDEPRIWDQLHLDFAWHTVTQSYSLTTLWLPAAYTKIFDKHFDEGEAPKAIIEHFQASRSNQEIEVKKKPKFRKLRKNQRIFRKLDLPPPPISAWDKFLDKFNKFGL